MGGNRLGKYELLKLIGRGAAGSVYESWDPTLDRKVAIKILSPFPDRESAGEHYARFKREARIVARLQHPNIVSVYEYAETADSAYIVMEYVDGVPLNVLVAKEGPLHAAEAARIMQGILAGLEYSHQQGIIHRDIKPSNIVLTKSGQPKIADFGVAHFEASTLTRPGTVIGTPAYMSPEQVMGRELDRRTDTYSAGAVLYQMITGKRPFEGDTVSVMHKIVSTPPQLPSRIFREVPHGFDTIITAAMAKPLNERYQSAAEFSQALDRELARHQSKAPIGKGASARPDATAIVRPRERLSHTSHTGRSLRGSASLLPAGRPKRSVTALLVAGLCAILVVGAVGAYLRGSRWHAGAEYARQDAPGEPPADLSDPPPNMHSDVTPLPHPEDRGQPKADSPGPSRQESSTTAEVPTDSTKQAATDGAGSTTQRNVVVAAAPPPAVIRPPISDDALRNQIKSAVASARCSLIKGDITDSRTVKLTGISGDRTVDQALTRAIASVAPDHHFDVEIRRFNGPFCGAVDMLRPIAQEPDVPQSRLRAALADDQYRLHDGNLLRLRLTMPDFPAYLRVDYLSHSGAVLHLVPSAAIPAHPYDPTVSVHLGDSPLFNVRWEISGPFGTDMVTVIASSVPLPIARKEEQEQAGPYLRELSAALAWAQQQGAQLAADAVLVETSAR